MIFFDIETISDKTANSKLKEKYWDKSNFMPEFNKIITIVVGRIETDNTIKTKILEWTEQQMIEKFFDIVKNKKVCWYNIKNFDMPFILKRALKHKVSIPYDFILADKKPWENKNIIDLFEIYKCWVF